MTIPIGVYFQHLPVGGLRHKTIEVNAEQNGPSVFPRSCKSGKLLCTRWDALHKPNLELVQAIR